ncbi:MAG: cytochrome c family protein [Rhodospirillaceae bacterium]|nr:cytochrome c family protein [Rhodospirillaceae bacterium]|tara:strand:+ start:384 stop:764 length:381 start_codon:yes stop_codon:yes gene_type:complete
MNSITKLTGIAISAVFLFAGPVWAEGNAKLGKKVFNKCRACHALKPGKKKLGPSLHGVIGRKAGSESYFKYSPAMKSSGIEWTEENLEKYLQAPKKFIPKNRMAFGGLKKKKDRKNIIAYIKSISK